MTITAREVHLAIKKGQTAAEFGTKYGITGDEVLDYIRERMNAGAKDLIRELQKNEKKRRRKDESESDSPETETADAQEETEDTSESDTTSDIEIVVVSTTGNLASLRQTEAEMSKELIELEKAHEAMAQTRRQILEKARETSQRVAKIQEELLEAEKMIEDLAIEYDVLAEDMATNTAERRSYEDLLDEVRGEIEVLSRVTAVVKANGNVECSNPEFMEMITPESENAELTKLMAMNEAEDFTLRQLKGIAKARLLSELGVSVTFEIPEVQNLI